MEDGKQRERGRETGKKRERERERITALQWPHARGVARDRFTPMLRCSKVTVDKPTSHSLVKSALGRVNSHKSDEKRSCER